MTFFQDSRLSTARLWCVIAIAQHALFGTLGCTPSNVPNANVRELKCDLSSPIEFANQVMTDPTQAYPSDPNTFFDAIQESADVQFVRHDSRFGMTSELIVLNLSRDGLLSIHVNSAPMTLSDSYRCTLSACRVLSIDEGKITDWWAKKEYSRVGASIQNNGGMEEFSATVQLRSSLETDLPWRVRVEINMQIPAEDAARLLSQAVK